MSEDEKRARLAQALRDNLRKRKAQARGHRTGDAPGPDGESEPEHDPVS